MRLKQSHALLLKEMRPKRKINHRISKDLPFLIEYLYYST